MMNMREPSKIIRERLRNGLEAKVIFNNQLTEKTMNNFDIDNVLKISKLTSELDFERASALESKLRWMIKEDPSLKPLRQHLRELIKAYETVFWLDEKSITDSQITESDKALELVRYENQFIQKRKSLIKQALEENGLTQQDLAKILGHRKSYMSELINGIRPFSLVDLVIINRLLKIKLDCLVITIIKDEIVTHLKEVLTQLNKPNLKLEEPDLDLVLA
jgi:transcriptional regulator with XRE-family HTH domain